MTTRLQLYNAALRLCGQRRLASLTEENEARRLLDDVWADGWVDACLEAGFWKFAMRTQHWTYDPSVEPEFGYIRAFEKPADWIRPFAICTDEHLRTPLLLYQDDGDYLFCDLDDLYVRFVSNDATLGADLSRWTSAFATYAAAYGAAKIIPKLSADKSRVDAITRPRVGALAQALTTAKNLDAMNENTRFAPPGGWVLARGSRGGGGPFGDGGSSGSLLG